MVHTHIQSTHLSEILALIIAITEIASGNIQPSVIETTPAYGHCNRA